MKQKTITHSIIALMSALALAGCGGSSSGTGDTTGNTTGDTTGDTTYPTPDTTKNPDSRENATLANTMKQLSTVVAGVDTNGTATGENVRPLLVTYLQQVKGDYETGDGSADIGDPYHVDGVFASLSLDNGKTWKKFEISDTSDKWSATVEWAGDKNFRYPGHAQRPTFAAYGNNIMVAWNDKYCPSGNPLLLEGIDGSYPDDYFGVNGNQKYVDYEGIVAPNDKTVYQVPFSCVWTARGIFDPATKEITWHAPMQLTTGVRDSNKIWIEASASGFAMTWQEDPEGLRSGKGEGPGDGWSGATTNHGADIWYSSLKMEEFNTTVATDDETVKPKSANNFHYPVRITDNQKCKVNDANAKPYCVDLCAEYGDPDGDGSCNTGYTDMLDGNNTTLNGDTGASRPALKILNDEGTDIVILGYEETKGLSESNPGVPNNESPETNIELEGKSVYFESFAFDAFYDFNKSEGNTSVVNVKADDTLELPLVSAGKIVNLKVADQNDPEKLIYENARRLVIGSQIDPSDEHTYTFAFLYKQGVETQGGSSDMYVRVNTGYTYDTFVALPDANVGELNATNVSSQVEQDVDSNNYAVNWTPTNLTDSSFENSVENTFSPRIFLRGYDIFVGYVYTPSDNKSNQFNMPINFHHNIYTNGAWQGPVNVTGITKSDVTTVDPRFIPTAKGTTGLPSDTSNPDVMFLTWGTMESTDVVGVRAEGNLYYKRGFKQADGTWVWDANQSAISKLVGDNPTEIEEEQVQSFASPDGSMLFNVWIQETEHEVYLENINDRDYGLGTWFKRLDFNSTSDTNGTTAIDVNDTGSMLVSKSLEL